MTPGGPDSPGQPGGRASLPHGVDLQALSRCWNVHKGRPKVAGHEFGWLGGDGLGQALREYVAVPHRTQQVAYPCQFRSERLSRGPVQERTERTQRGPQSAYGDAHVVHGLSVAGAYPRQCADGCLARTVPG